MKLISLPRGGGKTTKLISYIEVLEECGVDYVVCVGHRATEQYLKAKVPNIDLNGRTIRGLNDERMRGRKPAIVLIDDLDAVLESHFGTGVIATVSTNRGPR